MKDNNLYFKVLPALFSIKLYKIFKRAVFGQKVQVFAYVGVAAVAVVDVWLHLTQNLHFSTKKA